MWESGVFVLGRISKPGGKRGKLALVFGVFHAFPRGVISTALFLSSSSERSDAESRPPCRGTPFRPQAKICDFLTDILRPNAPGP